jgi:hypothetical protein
MPVQAVAREAPSQPDDQLVPSHLRQHARGGDGGTAAVAAHQGGLLAGPAAQGKHTIDQHELRQLRQLREGPAHGLFGGGPDAEPIDFPGGRLTQGPGQGPLADQRHERRPAACTQPFAVGESLVEQRADGWGWEHHRAGQDRTEQTAPPDFIDPGAVGGI